MSTPVQITLIICCTLVAKTIISTISDIVKIKIRFEPSQGKCTVKLDSKEISKILGGNE